MKYICLKNIFFFFSLLLSADSAFCQSLKIGHVTDLTGKGAFLGTQTVRGAKLAIEEMNQTRPGHVSLVTEDTGGSAHSAVSAAKKLLDIDKVDALLCDTTPICTAIAPITEAKLRPLVYQAPVASIAMKYKSSRRNFLDYEEACAAVVKEWKARGISSVGVLAVNLEFGDLCVEGAKRSGELTEYRYNPGDDLNSAHLMLDRHRVQAVLHVGYENDFLAWAKICAARSFGVLHGFADIMLSKTFRAEIGTTFNGATIMGYKPIEAAFLDSLNQGSSGSPNPQGAAVAYNALLLFRRAFDNCPTKDLECLVQSLRRPKMKLLMSAEADELGIAYPIALSTFENH
jgi:hypothetical protein